MSHRYIASSKTNHFTIFLQVACNTSCEIASISWGWLLINLYYIIYIKTVHYPNSRLILERSRFSNAIDFLVFCCGTASNRPFLFKEVGLLNKVGTASGFKHAFFFPRPNDCTSSVPCSKQDPSKCLLHNTECSVGSHLSLYLFTSSAHFFLIAASLETEKGLLHPC